MFNFFVVVFLEEGKKSFCFFDGEVIGKDDVCIVFIEFIEEVVLWSGEFVYESNLELLGWEIEFECKNVWVIVERVLE